MVLTMTTTLVEQLNFTVPAGNAELLPKLSLYDPIEFDGSLMLFEPGNPLAKMTAVPAPGAAAVNLLAPLAAPLLGSGDLHPRRSNMADANTLVALELTSKGGLHGIAPRKDELGGSGVAFGMPAVLTKYLMDNRTHDVYFSMWMRITRLATSNQIYGILAGGSQQTNSCKMTLHGSTSLAGSRPIASTEGYVTAPSILPDDARAVGRDVFIVHQSNGWYGYTSHGLPTDPMVNAVAGARAVSGWGWGCRPPTEQAISSNGVLGTHSVSSADVNQGSSHVIYRSYVEDLTVSGRSRSAVEAIDRALWETAFAPGGRYYGDTYSDPAVVRPAV